MKKISLAIITLIIIGIFIPAVSADELVYDEELKQIIDKSKKGSVKNSAISGGTSYSNHLNTIYFNDITNFQELSYITFDMPNNQGYDTDLNYLSSGRHEFTYNFNGKNRPGVVYIERHTNILGTITSTTFIIFLNDWDIGSLSGEQWITLPIIIHNAQIQPVGLTQGLYFKSSMTNTDIALTLGTGWFSVNGDYKYYVSHANGINWLNHIKVLKTTGEYDGYNIILNRTIDNTPFTSKINITKNGVTVFYSDAHGTDLNEWFLSSSIDLISIINPQNREYIYPLGDTTPDEPGEPGEPGDASVIVYIKNSQTGALIANSRIVIDGLVDGEYYNVVNRTEPSGIFTINLQPTGGGKSNPDGYRLIVTADGYNNPMPEINFTLGDYRKYFECFLDPIAGGPVNENKTFIDFFVRDMSSNPISGATVKFGKYTLITNSAGYTVFEVDKNNNYTWTISKSGYGPLTGNAVIGDAPRHTINTVLAPIVTPTTPTTTTPMPTSPPIGPTPTMTAPTGEPVSNWLEWFAAHFGMILGGGVEIGKIFMWLCFTVPVGVYVGKEAKAGAAGFMAGAGIVTLFFVLIGWVPIWLVVLMALVIGLLYAKAFNSQDNGGGR